MVQAVRAIRCTVIAVEPHELRVVTGIALTALLLAIHMRADTAVSRGPCEPFPAGPSLPGINVAR
jgi:hypothetical protein